MLPAPSGAALVLLPAANPGRRECEIRTGFRSGIVRVLTTAKFSEGRKDIEWRRASRSEIVLRADCEGGSINCSWAPAYQSTRGSQCGVYAEAYGSGGECAGPASAVLLVELGRRTDW